MKYVKGNTFIGDVVTLTKVRDLGDGIYIFTLNKEIPVGHLIKSVFSDDVFIVTKLLRRYNGFRMIVKLKTLDK